MLPMWLAEESAHTLHHAYHHMASGLPHTVMKLIIC